ncbi:MAG: hypothetical protein ABEJ40_03280 [Haloarculaceae archaeon]
MTAAQSAALLLYAVSVVAGYPSERKPGVLTPTVSAGLKVLTVVVVVFGMAQSLASLSVSRFLGWFGVLAGIGAMAVFEAVVDGTKLWQVHRATNSTGTADAAASNVTAPRPSGSSGNDSALSSGDSAFDDDSFDDGAFDDDSFDDGIGSGADGIGTGADGSSGGSDDGTFGEDSFGDNGPVDDSFGDNGPVDGTFGDDAGSGHGSFSVDHAGDPESIETRLNEVEDHLDDLRDRRESIDHASLVDHLEAEFDEVEPQSGQSIVINGDVVIDRHEEHTDAREITDETTVDDSVINRSEVDTGSPSMDDG